MALWQVLGAGAAGVGALWLAATGTSAKPAPVAVVASAPAAVSAAPAVSVSEPTAPAVSLAQLEAKPPETLSSSEVFSLAQGRATREREAAAALRQKLAANPELAKDKALQAELLRLAGDADTAPDALGAMARLPSSIGPDLLYEAWTATSTRSDATELARSLVYSTDVRPNASAALAVALELRAAQSCDDFKLALPKALKDGDRRVVHLLTKLNSKRGCGAKKAHDCFACLREPKDELSATINAVKSRRAPSYPEPTP